MIESRIASKDQELDVVFHAELDSGVVTLQAVLQRYGGEEIYTFAVPADNASANLAIKVLLAVTGAGDGGIFTQIDAAHSALELLRSLPSGPAYLHTQEELSSCFRIWSHSALLRLAGMPLSLQQAGGGSLRRSLSALLENWGSDLDGASRERYQILDENWARLPEDQGGKENVLFVREILDAEPGRVESRIGEPIFASSTVANSEVILVYNTAVYPKVNTYCVLHLLERATGLIGKRDARASTCECGLKYCESVILRIPLADDVGKALEVLTGAEDLKIKDQKRSCYLKGYSMLLAKVNVTYTFDDFMIRQGVDDSPIPFGASLEFTKGEFVTRFGLKVEKHEQRWYLSTVIPNMPVDTEIKLVLHSEEVNLEPRDPRTYRRWMRQLTPLLKLMEEVHVVPDGKNAGEKYAYLVDHLREEAMEALGRMREALWGMANEAHGNPIHLEQCQTEVWNAVRYL